MIPYSRQNISDADVAEVARVLRSDFLTQGPEVPRFEKTLSDYCQVPHAAAVASGTAALHLACQAMGLGPGDRLWTSPVTFVASANCARYCGADVDFVDIDPLTFNLSAEALRAKLESAEREGKLPKVVVPVHLGGQSCAMREIRELAEHYGCKVLEDASHALGGKYDGGPVGDGRFSDAAVFSFHPVKMITTGEGGAVMTRDAELHEKILRLRTHGITREAGLMHSPSPGAWYYEQLELGEHYRLTDLQAVLGTSQMARLGNFVAERRRLAARYDERLAGLPLQFQREEPGAVSSRHLYLVRLENGRRGEVFAAMRNAGIGVNVHYIPVYKQPYYRTLGFPADYCPEAERYYAGALSLPLFFGMTEAQQDEVVVQLAKALKN